MCPLEKENRGNGQRRNTYRRKPLQNQVQANDVEYILDHTGIEEDYGIYKEALNQATAETRNSKRSYEQQLASNIKHNSKSFYAYVRSKQKVQD